MLVGINLVEMEEFKIRLDEAGSLEHLFLPSELRSNAHIEILVGLFAAKEAFFKALGEHPEWLDVEVHRDSHGSVTLYSERIPEGSRASVSITHSGNYAGAVVIIHD